MAINLGARVMTSDGEELGKISRLVLDLSGQNIRSVVVEHGVLLKDAYEVAADSLIDSGGEAELTISSSEAKKLPRYDESRYTEVPESVAAPFGFPSGGIIWPIAAPPAAAPYGQGVYPVAAVPEEVTSEVFPEQVTEPDERWETERRAEQENAVIERGAQVLSSDGESVGEVDSVSFDPGTGHPVSFLVRRGLLFSEDVEIPASAVASVDDDIVTLKADKERIDLWSRDQTVLLF